ncbi:FAD-dependent oxidoreductase [Halovenus halobia]|uniref:FAD-dependent oxidoreductase n=1 Tax=Halovenus halobia TaxID=3396622 RepID=UPI003F57D529
MGYTPQVIVIGGGVLGTAIARDCALRGLEVTLVEQGTLTAGTTGSIHGPLYSGARFVEEDPAGAMRCFKESNTLRETAAHCIEETDGIIVDGEEFDDFVAACEKRSIPASKLSGEIDGVSANRAARVPDAVVDPFALTLSNAASADAYGAEFETGARVVDLLTDGSDIVGVEVEYDSAPGGVSAPTRPSKGVPDETEPVDGEDESADEGTDEDEADEEDEDEDEDEENTPDMPGTVQRTFPGATGDDTPETGEREEIEADYVINAAGAWADQIAALAGIKLPLSRERGRMVVLSSELVDQPVTRRQTGLPLTVAPYQGNTIVGPIAESTDIEDALASAAEFVPGVSEAEVLRTYSGVWTQHGGSSGSPYGHGATLVDHDKYDDRWGMLSVLGGSVTTHRFVAEQAVNRVCGEFGIGRSCLTEELSLPEPLTGREQSSKPDPVLCETRSVRQSTVQQALDESELRTELDTVRMRTGATMGECQGGRCGHRIAAELYPESDLETVEEALETLLARRWHGRRESLDSEQLAAAMDDYELHARVLGRDGSQPETVDLDSFDGSGFSTRTFHERDDEREDDSILPVPEIPTTADGRVQHSEAVGR